jgi:hypothetical protein
MLEIVTKINRKVHIFVPLSCCGAYDVSARPIGTAYRSHRTAQYNHVLRVRNSIRRVIARKFFIMQQPPRGPPGPPHYPGCTITLRHTILARAPLDEWSARRRDLYLKTHKLTRDRRLCPRRDSNQKSQQTRGRRPTPWTARLLGSPARKISTKLILFIISGFN